MAVLSVRIERRTLPDTPSEASGPSGKCPAVTSHRKTPIEHGDFRGVSGPSGTVRQRPADGGANRPGCVSVRSRTPPGRSPVRMRDRRYQMRTRNHPRAEPAKGEAA